MTYCGFFDVLRNIKPVVMKNLLISFCLVFLSVSCSSDDNPADDPLQDAHFNLTLNGAGFNNLRIAINRHDINILNENRLAVRAGDEGLENFFGFYLPFPIETTTYTMVEGSGSTQNSAFYARNQYDTYYTENGSVIVSDIFEDDACQILEGSLNINLSLVGDPSQILNISGTFEVPTEQCE